MIPGYGLRGTSQEVVYQARNTLLKEWQSLLQELIDWWCINFHRNLKLSLEQDGKNNYNA